MVNWAILPQPAHAPPFAAHPQGGRTITGRLRRSLSPIPLLVTTPGRLIGYDQAAANGVSLTRQGEGPLALAVGDLMEEYQD